jgi:hypothetical protein
MAGATLAQAPHHSPGKTAVILSARQKSVDLPTSRQQGTISSEEALSGSFTLLNAGMIVLSSSMHILHMNGQARSLMASFGAVYELWPHPSPESMPAIITEFCDNVLSELRRRADNQQWTALDMRRVCHMVTPSLLLRGFGMPDADGQDPRMILILQLCHS